MCMCEVGRELGEGLGEGTHMQLLHLALRFPTEGLKPREVDYIETIKLLRI